MNTKTQCKTCLGNSEWVGFYKSSFFRRKWWSIFIFVLHHYFSFLRTCTIILCIHSTSSFYSGSYFYQTSTFQFSQVQQKTKFPMIARNFELYCWRKQLKKSHMRHCVQQTCVVKDHDHLGGVAEEEPPQHHHAAHLGITITIATTTFITLTITIVTTISIITPPLRSPPPSEQCPRWRSVPEPFSITLATTLNFFLYNCCKIGGVGCTTSSKCWKEWHLQFWLQWKILARFPIINDKR